MIFITIAKIYELRDTNFRPLIDDSRGEHRITLHPDGSGEYEY